MTSPTRSVFPVFLLAALSFTAFTAVAFVGNAPSPAGRRRPAFAPQQVQPLRRQDSSFLTRTNMVVETELEKKMEVEISSSDNNRIINRSTTTTTGVVASAASNNNGDGDELCEAPKEMSEAQRLMEQVKNAGTAGIISYALWELGFWTISVPVCIFGYREVTGHWPDLSNVDDQAKLGAEAFAFVNFARFAVPLRIGLALSTTPWIQENIVDRFMNKANAGPGCEPSINNSIIMNKDPIDSSLNGNGGAEHV